MKPILEVKNLSTYFYSESGIVKAVDNVNFSVKQGEVVGLVGESGCGKSVTSLSIMRLIDFPGRIVSGTITFQGRNLLELSDSEMTDLRGSRISMIFQQPQSSLNPVQKIGDQVAEVFQVHNGMGRDESWRNAIQVLNSVGIPDAENKAHAYPHEISGGQAQRVMIAIALALSPQLLIADEPTTALDVTIQAQILDLLRALIENTHTSVILITHDLGIIAEMANRVAVMYAGRIVEETRIDLLFENPLHPYSQGLISSIPQLGIKKDMLDVIPGNVPDLINLPNGCKFAPRCQSRMDHHLSICEEAEPELKPFLPDHHVRCWLMENFKE